MSSGNDSLVGVQADPGRDDGGSPLGSVRMVTLVYEVVLRVVLVVFAAALLPAVFNNDLVRFRLLANCMVHPSAQEIARACRPGGVELGHLTTGINLPYRSVLSEYPPAGLASVFLTGRWVGSLRIAQIAFALPMVVVEVATLEVLRRAWPSARRALTRWWYPVVLPVAMLGWFRMDFLAVLGATVGLVGLEQNRRRNGWIVFGWLVKLWPVSLLAGLAVRRRWSEFLRAGFGVLAVTSAWFAFGPTGFREFLRFRAGSGLQVESLPASLLFWKYHGHTEVVSGASTIGAGGYGWVNPVSIGLLATFSIGCMLWAWRAPHTDVVALCGALTLATVVISRIISPQYLLWVAPFVVVLAGLRRHRRLGVVAVAASCLTLLYLPWYRALEAGSKVVMFIVFLRNIMLVWLLIEFVVVIRSPIRRGNIR